MEIPRHWRLKKERYNLVGKVCTKGHKIFPPKPICPDCHGEVIISFSSKLPLYTSDNYKEVLEKQPLKQEL